MAEPGRHRIYFDQSGVDLKWALVCIRVLFEVGQWARFETGKSVLYSEPPISSAYVRLECPKHKRHPSRWGRDSRDL